HGIPPLTWLDGDRGAPGPPGARRPGRRRSDPAVRIGPGLRGETCRVQGRRRRLTPGGGFLRRATSRGGARGLARHGGRGCPGAPTVRPERSAVPTPATGAGVSPANPRHRGRPRPVSGPQEINGRRGARVHDGEHLLHRLAVETTGPDRKSTRLNSSHVKISYAVFC